ncbi:MAG: hypothetical protein VXZ96_08140 [Myxococcota bacterium]|nr:hypothetical protein [Myxococcota bacterium]MEC8380276.1 hypothetical protein [Myxococcota bacterium]
MIWSLLIHTALAHKPSFGGSFTSPDSAFDIIDADISIVVYQELTCDNPELWMAFDVEPGYELYVQLGVPVIDRLDSYFPSVAVVAAGFPQDADVPFDLPEGMGALVFDAEPDSADFFEPFTQTESWIWREEWVEITQGGAGFVVGWHPEELTGKIWLATGEVEDFSDVNPADFAYWNEAVNNFHETGEFERPPETDVQSCQDNALEESSSKSGCSVMASPIHPLMMALPFGFICLRRRMN